MGNRQTKSRLKDTQNNQQKLAEEEEKKELKKGKAEEIQENELPQCAEADITSDDVSVNSLPNEILSEIFSYLTHSELAKSVLPVCHRWNQVGSGPILWRRLKFGLRGNTEDVLKTLGKSTLLKSLEINKRNDFECILDEMYNNDISFLEELKVQMPGRPHKRYGELWNRVKTEHGYEGYEFVNHNKHLPRSWVDSIPPSTTAKTCPNLKKLTLENVVFRNRSRRLFSVFRENLALLTSLTVAYCEPVFTSDDLKLVAANCTHLSHLIILQDFWNLYLDNVGFVNRWDAAYCYLFQKRGAQLQVLNLDARIIRSGTLSYLHSSSTGRRRLHTLGLENAHKLPAKDIAAIRGFCLKHLRIQFGSNLTTLTFALLFAPDRLGRLQTLCLPKCNEITDPCVKIIAFACPWLKKLDVSFCTQITDVALAILFQRCVELRYLAFSFALDGIHGSSFHLIPEETPNLRVLVVDRFVCEMAQPFLQDLCARCPELVKVRSYTSLVVEISENHPQTRTITLK